MVGHRGQQLLQHTGQIDQVDLGGGFRSVLDYRDMSGTDEEKEPVTGLHGAVDVAQDPQVAVVPPAGDVVRGRVLVAHAHGQIAQDIVSVTETKFLFGIQKQKVFA